jgi:hypothetical protein
MITKKKLLKSIKELPESFSVDEIIDRVMLLQKIETGLEQSSNGQVHSTVSAKRLVKKWLK